MNDNDSFETIWKAIYMSRIILPKAFSKSNIVNAYTKAGICSLNYSKMYEEFSEAYKDYNTMSVLVLRNFLYQL